MPAQWRRSPTSREGRSVMPASTSVSAASDRTSGRRLALVVAVATYEDDDLSRLRTPARDARALRDLLADPEVGGFSVTSVIDEDARQVRIALEEFLADRAPDDLLLVYLSCHGLVDPRRRLYFAARDTRKDRLASSGVEARWLLDQFEDCRARRQVVILDCCFSGAFAQGTKGEADLGLGERLMGQGRGRVVLTASRATEYSFEGQSHRRGPGGTSVFTGALVAGIRSGGADTDGDGYISVDDAYTYAYDEVRRTGADQTPQRWMYGAESDIVLARAPSGAAADAGTGRTAPRISAGSDGGDTDALAARHHVGWSARRTALVLGTFLAGLVVVLAGVLLTRDGAEAPSRTDPSATDPSPTSPTAQAQQSGPTISASGTTITASAPWRLRVDGTASDEDGGCAVVLLRAADGRRWRWSTIYQEETFQVSEAGTFRWSASDPACRVTADEGAGRRSLPFEQQFDTGDSAGFAPVGTVRVSVLDFNESGPCTIDLHSVSDGERLDFRTVAEDGGPALLDPRGEDLVYLRDPQCTVRVSEAP